MITYNTILVMLRSLSLTSIYIIWRLNIRNLVCVLVCLSMCYSHWWNLSWMPFYWTLPVSGRSAVHPCSSWLAQHLWVQHLSDAVQTPQWIATIERNTKLYNMAMMMTLWNGNILCWGLGGEFAAKEEPWFFRPARQGAAPAGRWSQMCLWRSTLRWDIHSSLEGTRKKKHV